MFTNNSLKALKGKRILFTICYKEAGPFRDGIITVDAIDHVKVKEGGRPARWVRKSDIIQELP